MKLILFFLLILITVSLAFMDPDAQSHKISRKNRVARSERIHVTTHRPGDFRPFTGKKTTLKNWFN